VVFGVTVRLMSDGELQRLEVLLNVQSGGLRVADAYALLDLKRRQVFRLLAGLKHGGAASLISKRRGRQ
jgi:Winged helix-turn helix